MLSVNSYAQPYIDGCRSRMESQLAAYNALVAAARANQGPRSSAVAAAVDSFEPQFFNHLVLVLDGYFAHRSRTLELKDGNPLNEVRMLCNSILQNGGVLAADKTIKFNPATSVSKVRVGDEIRLTETDFIRLFKAYFKEIEAKFG